MWSGAVPEITQAVKMADECVQTNECPVVIEMGQLGGLFAARYFVTFGKFWYFHSR